MRVGTSLNGFALPGSHSLRSCIRIIFAFVMVHVIAGAVMHVSSAWQTAPSIFSDAAKQAGINFKHENGASPQKYLPETMSAGAVIFDYDNDGWPDIFLVNGGSFVDRGTATAARHRLYHNERDGRFTD